MGLVIIGVEQLQDFMICPNQNCIDMAKHLEFDISEIDMARFDKVEYKQVRLLTRGDQLVDQLNELGKDGWELIEHDDGNWLFKRVIRGDSSKYFVNNYGSLDL